MSAKRIGVVGSTAIGLVLAGSTAAQNYRLSAEPVIELTEDVESYQLAGERVVCAIRLRDSYASSSRVRIWSARVDGSGSFLVHEDLKNDMGGWQLSPDGQWIAIGLDARVRILRSDGSSFHDIAAHELQGLNVFDLVISPDSKRVVFRAGREPSSPGSTIALFSARLDGTERIIELNGALAPGNEVTGFRMSADGARVAYLSDEDERGTGIGLFTTPIDRREPRGPLNDYPSYRIPKFEFSHDGETVAFVEDYVYVSALWVAPTDSSGLAVVRSAPGYFKVPDFVFSPSDTHLWYDTYNYSPLLPHIVSVRTGEDRLFTDSNLRFAADGEHIFYHRDGELVRDSVAGGEPKRLHPSFGAFELSPGDRTIVFAAMPNAIHAVPSDGSRAPLLSTHGEGAHSGSHPMRGGCSMRPMAISTPSPSMAPRRPCA